MFTIYYSPKPNNKIISKDNDERYILLIDIIWNPKEKIHKVHMKKSPILHI